VVDGTKKQGDSGFVLIDTLVKPDHPVTDYRTKINGIREADLTGVAFTLKHAQKFMARLCTSETIIAGHAIHNDLISLKMKHYRTLDSAFLYKVDGESSAPPSLKDCVFSILDGEMPATHDSVNDAAQAMRLIQEFLDNGCQQLKEVVRTKRADRPGGGGSGRGPSASNAGDSLFIHRVPKEHGTEYVKKLFTNHVKVIPRKVDPMEVGGGEFSKTIVWFESDELCRAAFDAFAGPVVPDKEVRARKRAKRERASERSARGASAREERAHERSELSQQSFAAAARQRPDAKQPGDRCGAPAFSSFERAARQRAASTGPSNRRSRGATTSSFFCAPF
jgi:hypothetical protein